MEAASEELAAIMRDLSGVKGAVDEQIQVWIGGAGYEGRGEN